MNSGIIFSFPASFVNMLNAHNVYTTVHRAWNAAKKQA